MKCGNTKNFVKISYEINWFRIRNNGYNIVIYCRNGNFIVKLLMHSIIHCFCVQFQAGESVKNNSRNEFIETIHAMKQNDFKFGERFQCIYYSISLKRVEKRRKWYLYESVSSAKNLYLFIYNFNVDIFIPMEYKYNWMMMYLFIIFDRANVVASSSCSISCSRYIRWNVLENMRVDCRM